MANPNRGPRGRFSRRVNNQSPPPKQPQKDALFAKSEPVLKKQRLNDGSAQKIPISRPPPNQPENKPSLASAPPAQPYELKQLVEDQKNYPLRSGQDVVNTASPVSKPSVEDKRTLRSQDTTRPRSELANFFADYEDVVFGKDDAQELLTEDVRLHVSNDTPSSRIRRVSSKPTASSPASRRDDMHTHNLSPLANNAITREVPPMSNKPKPSGQLSRKINLPRSTTLPSPNGQDPLADEIYDIAHKRGERKEKQSRNWDKERAMHEKGELERLLEELRGPDWLKLMGISGVSETEVKRLKEKRNIFITRARTMLERYDAWRERDKELKLERDRKLARLQESSVSEPDSSRASAALSEDVADTRSIQRDAKSREPAPSKQAAPPESKPFTSFFEKPHLREAALKGYRRGRHALAFGHPIPDLPEISEFELPPEVMEGKSRYM